MRTYTHTEMHAAMCDRFGHDAPPDIPESPALFCPYYVPLRGVLGADWGVVVNPDSVHFGDVVFEHDWCGCRVGSHETGHQRTDEWRDRKREREEERR
jgi:hypothetical protein